jgi:hypothetical protein
VSLPAAPVGAAGAAGLERRWRSNPLVDVHVELLGPSCAAHEAVSGQIAALEPVDAAVLALVDSQGRSTADIVLALAQEAALAVGPELESSVNEALERLAERGWIEGSAAPG